MTRKWLSQTPNPKIIEVLNSFSVSSSAKQPSLNIETFLSYFWQDPFELIRNTLFKFRWWLITNLYSPARAHLRDSWREPNQSLERLTTYNHTTSAFKGIRTADFPSASFFIGNNNVLKSNISAYRKGHLTTLYLKQYEMKGKLRSIRR